MGEKKKKSRRRSIASLLVFDFLDECATYGQGWPTHIVLAHA